MLVGLIDILQYTSFGAALAFLVVYPGWRGRGRWFKSPEGRQLVAAYVVFALVLALAVAHNALGIDWMRWSGRLWADAAVYAALTGVFTWQVVIVLLARSRRRRPAPADRGQGDGPGEMQSQEAEAHE